MMRLRCVMDANSVRRRAGGVAGTARMRRHGQDPLRT
jgi:hypothetical protein